MGWGSGSILFSDIMIIMQEEVPNLKSRKRLYEKLWEAFTDMDWDTEGDCLGEDPAFDELYYEKYPDDID